MKRTILASGDGRIAMVESNPNLGTTEIIGFEPTNLELSDKDWKKMRRDMGTHDISLDRKHNSLKITKRKKK